MIPSLLFLAGVFVGLSILRITKMEKAPAQSSKIDPDVVIAAGITIGLIFIAAKCVSNNTAYQGGGTNIGQNTLNGERQDRSRKNDDQENKSCLRPLELLGAGS